MSGETEVEEIMGTVTDVYNLRHLRHSGRGSGFHQGDGRDSGVWLGHPVQPCPKEEGGEQGCEEPQDESYQ